MKLIELSNGKFASVDDADFEALSKYAWSALKYKRKNKIGWYAVRFDGPVYVFMHRAILGLKNSQFDVDHKNGDTLDNQRNNLRRATRSQNLQNREKSPGFSSKFKGVSFFKRTGRWMAHIKINRKKHHLGYFDTEVEAAGAYNVAAARLFGEFARLNSL